MVRQSILPKANKSAKRCCGGTAPQQVLPGELKQPPIGPRAVEWMVNITGYKHLGSVLTARQLRPQLMHYRPEGLDVLVDYWSIEKPFFECERRPARETVVSISAGLHDFFHSRKHEENRTENIDRTVNRITIREDFRRSINYWDWPI
jgi:hypothetical protein